jgi:hypothetical protein
MLTSVRRRLVDLDQVAPGIGKHRQPDVAGVHRFGGEGHTEALQSLLFQGKR